jgi:hypothetical protein
LAALRGDDRITIDLGVAATAVTSSSCHSAAACEREVVCRSTRRGKISAIEGETQEQPATPVKRGRCRRGATWALARPRFRLSATFVSAANDVSA